MKIGVISDTHLNDYNERLKQIQNDFFFDVELILHAGDLVDIRVLDVFKGKEIKAVYGNMDQPSVKLMLPDRLIFDVGGFKIGLIHGWGSPHNMEEKLLSAIGKVDCLVYGHTHRPSCSMKEGTFFFNPGSPTDKRFSLHNTIGILEIDKEIKGKIIELRCN